MSKATKEDIFYKAMLARDYRFDGKFFVAVKTTGIYCRPICPARPKRENVEFFTDALAAENAGYRPCLRCRPESAPLSPAWHGRSAVVQRALKLIASGALLKLDEDRFADSLGVSARHLRRIFIEEVGKTPKQISDNGRLDFARKLITESDLPILTVAMSSGFSSLRRFNDSFKKRFERSPSEIRSAKRKGHSHASGGIELGLSYRPPFDWESVLKYHRNHRIEGIESADETGFERVFRIGSETGVFRVTADPEHPKLKLHVETERPKILFEIVRRVRRMFDLDSDPVLVANSFACDVLLDGLCRKVPGVRVPQGFDPFEATVNVILGQLVSVEQGRKLVRQLVENYGEIAPHPINGKPMRFFPEPKTIARADLSLVRTTEGRRNALREFSRRIAEKELSLSPAQDPDSFRKGLMEIPGIGKWTAECASIRALGDTDVFPSTDLLLKQVLRRHPDLDLKKVQPWRAYAAMHLWKEYAK